MANSPPLSLQSLASVRDSSQSRIQPPARFSRSSPVEPVQPLSTFWIYLDIRISGASTLLILVLFDMSAPPAYRWPLLQCLAVAWIEFNVPGSACSAQFCEHDKLFGNKCHDMLSQVRGLHFRSVWSSCPHRTWCPVHCIIRIQDGIPGNKLNAGEALTQNFQSHFDAVKAFLTQTHSKSNSETGLQAQLFFTRLQDYWLVAHEWWTMVVLEHVHHEKSRI